MTRDEQWYGKGWWGALEGLLGTKRREGGTLNTWRTQNILYPTFPPQDLQGEDPPAPLLIMCPHFALYHAIFLFKIL
jgi:hypothetical protein